jgi:hypothetical protein
MTTLEPRIRQAMERRLDEVVEWARQCVEETQITSTKMEESQLHNLLNIANATDSVKALENFVCYQMGRLKEWRHNDFGQRILEDFKRLGNLAQEIVKGSNTKERAVHMELIRLYTGFLYRWFVAKRPREGEES